MKPVIIDKLRAAFAADVSDLMPTKDPEWPRYRRDWHKGIGWGAKLLSDMFYHRVADLSMRPKEGIDPEIALKHIQTIMCSWDLKHEDKVAACQLLFEKWFESATWKRKEAASDKK